MENSYLLTHNHQIVYKIRTSYFQLTTWLNQLGNEWNYLDFDDLETCSCSMRYELPITIYKEISRLTSPQLDYDDWINKPTQFPQE